MADFVGTVTSNTFAVKSVTQFTDWLIKHWFCDGEPPEIATSDNLVKFYNADVLYPSVSPVSLDPSQYHAEDDFDERAYLPIFCAEFANHLIDGEAFITCAGVGRSYVSATQLVIRPSGEFHISGMDSEGFVTEEDLAKQLAFTTTIGGLAQHLKAAYNF